MPNIVSPRAVFGLIVPSTNTTVEAEFNWMRAPGTSWHAGRIYIPEPDLVDDESFVKFLENLRTEIQRTVRDVITCKPDYMVMGMSAETFWGGTAGAAEFLAWMKELSGLDVTTGALACEAALKALGGKRLGIITPYQPVADAQVTRFFEEMGYEVAAIHGLKCSSATSIGDVTPDELREAFAMVNDSSVDVLIQAGTNMPVTLVAADLERELRKPVIAINTATVWHAYRANGIEDRFPEFGTLLADF